MKLFEDLPSTNTPITAENLNQIQNNLVVVSATEPTGDKREKVWIQRGKNLLNKNKLKEIFMETNSTIENLPYNAGTWTTEWIPCTPNTSYTISGNNRSRWQLKDEEGTITYVSGKTITTGANSKYLRCYCWSVENGELESANIQIEQGSVETSYEEYVEPKIYVKNNNNIYEEFIKEEDTGWVDLTLSAGISVVTADNATFTPQIRRIGKLVQIRGVVSGVKADYTRLATIPIGFRANANYPHLFITPNYNSTVNINALYCGGSALNYQKGATVGSSGSRTPVETERIVLNTMYFID